MSGLRKRRRTMKQALLRRAVLKTRNGNSIDRPALSDVSATSCSSRSKGVPVVSILAKDSQLVHIMQRSLSNSSWEPRRAKRISRVTPEYKLRRILSKTPFRSGAQRKEAGSVQCIGSSRNTATKSFRSCKTNDIASGHSLKPCERSPVSRSSRASSTGYPSSWNLEVVRDDQEDEGHDDELGLNEIANCDALKRTPYDHRLNEPVPCRRPKADNAVQCSLRPKPKCTILRCKTGGTVSVAQTQTILLSKRPVQKPKPKPCKQQCRQPRMRTKSIQSEQICSVAGRGRWLGVSGFGGQQGSNCVRHSRRLPHRVNSGKAESRSESASSNCCVRHRSQPQSAANLKGSKGKSQNFGGYTPSDRSCASNDSQNEFRKVIRQSSERFSRIEKISQPPELIDRRGTVSQISSAGQCSVDESESEFQQAKSNEKKKNKICSCRNTKPNAFRKNVGFEHRRTQHCPCTPSEQNVTNAQSAASCSCQCPSCSNAVSQTATGGPSAAVSSTGTGYMGSKSCQDEISSAKQSLIDCGYPEPSRRPRGQQNLRSDFSATCPRCCKAKQQSTEPSRSSAPIGSNGRQDNFNQQCSCNCPDCLKPKAKCPEPSITAAPNVSKGRKDNMKQQCSCKCPDCLRARTKSPETTKSESPMVPSGKQDNVKQQCSCNCPNCLKAKAQSPKHTKTPAPIFLNERQDSVKQQCSCKCPACLKNKAQSAEPMKTAAPFASNGRQDNIKQQCSCNCSGCLKARAQSPESEAPMVPRGRQDTARQQCSCKCPGCYQRKAQQSAGSPRPGSVAVKTSHVEQSSCQCKCPGCLKPMKQQQTNPLIQQPCSCKCPACIRSKAQATSSPARSGAASPQYGPNSSRPSSPTPRATATRNPTATASCCPCCTCSSNVIKPTSTTGVAKRKSTPPKTTAAKRRPVAKSSSPRQSNRRAEVRSSCPACFNSSNASISDFKNSTNNSAAQMQRTDSMCSNIEDNYNYAPSQEESKRDLGASATRQRHSSSALQNRSSLSSCYCQEDEPAATPKEVKGALSNVSRNKFSGEPGGQSEGTKAPKTKLRSSRSSDSNATSKEEHKCDCKCPNCGKEFSRQAKSTKRSVDENNQIQFNRAKQKVSSNERGSMQIKEQRNPQGTAQNARQANCGKSSANENKQSNLNRSKQLNSNSNWEPRKTTVEMKQKDIAQSAVTKSMDRYRSKSKQVIDKDVQCDGECNTNTNKTNVNTNATNADNKLHFTAESCNKKCGKCKITPAKTKLGEAMVNLVVDEKCNVTQIIEILQEAVAGLEEQKLFQNQNANGDQNANGICGNGASSPITSNKPQFNMPDNQMLNAQFGYGQHQNSCQCCRHTFPASNHYNNVPFHNQVFQSPVQNYMHHNAYHHYQNQYQQQPNNQMANKPQNCPFVPTANGPSKAPAARVVTQTDYEYPQTGDYYEEQPMNNYQDASNFENQPEDDFACCTTDNNNNINSPVRFMDPNAPNEAGCRTRSGGNPHPFEKDSKACSDRKRRTRQSLKPTQSFIQIFDMAMALKNNTCFKKDVISCGFNDPKLHIPMCNIRSGEHEYHLSHKTKRFLDLPDHSSYDTNMLEGLVKKKNAIKQIRRVKKSTKLEPVFVVEDLSNLESMEHINNAYREVTQTKSPHPLRGLGQPKADLSRKHFKQERDVSDVRVTYYEKPDRDLRRPREQPMQDSSDWGRDDIVTPPVRNRNHPEQNYQCRKHPTLYRDCSCKELDQGIGQRDMVERQEKKDPSRKQERNGPNYSRKYDSRRQIEEDSSHKSLKHEKQAQYRKQPEQIKHVYTSVVENSKRRDENPKQFNETKYYSEVCSCPTKADQDRIQKRPLEDKNSKSKGFFPCCNRRRKTSEAKSEEQRASNLVDSKEHNLQNQDSNVSMKSKKEPRQPTTICKWRQRDRKDKEGSDHSGTKKSLCKTRSHDKDEKERSDQSQTKKHKSRSRLSLCNRRKPEKTEGLPPSESKKSKSRSSLCGKRRKSEKKEEDESDDSKAKKLKSKSSLYLCNRRKQEKREGLDRSESKESKPQSSVSLCKRRKREKQEIYESDHSYQRPNHEKIDEEASQKEETKRSKSKSFNFFACLNRSKRDKKESVERPEAKPSEITDREPKQKTKSSSIFPCCNRSKKDKKNKDPPPTLPAKPAKKEASKSSIFSCLKRRRERRTCTQEQCSNDDVKVLYDSSYKFKNHSYAERDANTDCDCICETDTENQKTSSTSRNNFFTMLEPQNKFKSYHR